MVFISKKDMIFILFYAFLVLFSLLIIQYSKEQNQLSEMSNALYTKHAVQVENVQENMIAEMAGKISGARLFVELDQTFRYFIQGDHWSPMMQAGSFFSSAQESNTAVVGKEMLHMIEKRDGKEWVFYGKEEYEVIGILGAPYASRSDYIILLRPADHIPLVRMQAVIIDGNTESLVQKAVKNVLTMSDAFVCADRSVKGIERLANTTYFYKLLVLNTVLILFCGSCSFLWFWYKEEKKWIDVLILMGLAKWLVRIQVLRKVILNIFLAICISIFIFGALYGPAFILSAPVLLSCTGFLSGGILTMSCYMKDIFAAAGCHRNAC